MSRARECLPMAARADLTGPVYLAGLVALLVVSLFTGFYAIQLNDVTHDEAASLHFARLPFAEIPYALATEDSHGPLYFLALRVALLGGDGLGPVVAGRGLSVLFATGAVLVCVLLGTRVAGRRAGLLAGLLLALCPLHAEWAGEIRFYAMAEFLCVLHAFGVIVILQGAARRRWWILAGLAGGAALLTFYLSITVIAAGVMAALLGGDGRARRRVLLAAALSGLVGAAWLPAIRIQRKMAWIRVSWIPEQAVPTFLWEVLGHLSYGRSEADLLGVFSAVALGLALLAGAYALVRRWTAPGIALTLCATLPVVAVVAASIKQPMWVTRYVVVATPFLCIVVVVGLASTITWLRRRANVLTWTPVAVLLLALVAPVRSAWIDHTVLRPGARWNAAQAWLQTRLEPHETLVVAPAWDRCSIEHHFPHHERSQGIDRPQELPAIVAAGDRVWLIVAERAGHRSMAHLGEVMGAQEPQVFGDIHIYVFERGASDVRAR